jgi:hypothetical protein
MFKYNIILAFLSFLYLSFSDSTGIFGQEVLKFDKDLLTDYDIRIKQFNEFIDRFNFSTNFKGEKVSSEFKSKINRIDYIKILFNFQDPRLLKDKPSFSPAYRDLILEFVKEVSDDSIYISKYSDRIIASAKTRVKYKNEPKDISMYLSREVLSKNRIKWVIVSVYADFLDIVKEDTTMIRFIPPNSHELDFMNVKRAMEDKDHLDDYARKGYEYDPLSVFFFNIRNGNIVMDYVSEVEYFIFDIPGWCFRVKDFNRTSSNSGWLIDNIWKTNDDPIHFMNSL